MSVRRYRGGRVWGGACAVAVLAFGLLAPLADDARGEPNRAPSVDAGNGAGIRAELGTKLSQLLSSDRNMRRAAARSIEMMGPEATVAMNDELTRLSALPLADVGGVLALTHAAPEGATGDGGDRLDAVLDLSPDSAGLAFRQTAETLCLIRALSRAGTPEAVSGVALAALDARGAFRPDVTRHLADLGERAIAGLILASHARGGTAQKWATSALESLGKRTPGDAVQTKSKEVLADVLLAYGTTQDADALGVVLSFVNADRRLVRDAARQAIAEYGDRAVPKVRESYGLLTGVAPPPEWSAPWLEKKLFDVMDRIRLEDVDARVHEGLTAANDGHLAEAVADFDDVLARQPDWDRKAEMVPAYVFYGEALAATDRRTARTLLEKALRLDPDGPRRPQIESALLCLDGKDLEDRGLVAKASFERAIALDPGNAAAQAELLRILDTEVAMHKLWRRRVILATGLAVLLSALILFVGWGQRRAERRPRRA